MAHPSVVINGVVYNSVPSVQIPKQGGGTAEFFDSGDTTALASDLRAGATAISGGAEITGTAPEKSSSDVTVSGKTVSIPAGIYDFAVSKSVADGSVTPTASVSGDEIGTTASDYPITITPSATVSAGYVSGNKTGTAITRYIQTETKSATPTTSAQTITPTSGKLLSSVSVGAVNVTATATEAQVLNGYTFFANSLTIKTGTATVPTVSQDATTKVLSIA